MILVELAGAAGVGKSTAAPLLARRLREVLGKEAVAALPEKDLPRRHRRWRRIHRWLWMASHPQLVLAARRASQAEPKRAPFKTWLNAFSTMGIGRRALQKGVKVVLVDQGMLRLRMDAEHVPLLPAPLLPDLVLQLVADPAVLELRRIYRSKKNHIRLHGAARMARAQDSRRCMGGLPEDQLRDALMHFGLKFCEPALSEQEIEELLRPDATEPATHTAPPTSGRVRCAPEVCEGFRQRGVSWRQVDNSLSDGFDQVVEACLQAILSTLPAEGSKERPNAPFG